MIAVISLVTGLFESATIITIVAFIEGVTNEDLRWEVTAGPLDVALDRSDLILIALTSLVAMTVGQLLSSWLSARAVASWQYGIQMRAIRAYLAADWPTQSAESSGSLQNLVSLCNGSAQGLAGMMTLLSSAGAVLIFTIVAFVASPLAAGALLVTGIVLMSVLRPIRRLSREATHRATIGQRAVAEEVGEIHDLAQEIRVYDIAEAMETRVNRESRRVLRERRRTAVLVGLGSVMYRSLGLGFVLAATVIASSQSDLDIARVGVAGLLLLRSLSYGQSIQSAWQRIENNKPYIDQVSDALELYERSAPQRGDKRTDVIGRIELDGVSFSYGAESPALNRVGLIIEQGETLGIVGPSGSGKSTLAQILLGLREPSEGLYLTGGIAQQDLDGQDWFRLVTFVPQQPQLLRGTVVENIRFYRQWIDESDVVAAAKAAGLHEEIVALPHGYDTTIGGEIRQLSGGQRQRLGIARALAGHPQLLVLDEPTSALDAISESRIQDTLIRLKGEVTVVIIAHRLATLNHCDRLLVLEEGVVHALDKPSAVMKQSDFYRRAVSMQLVGAADDATGA